MSNTPDCNTPKQTNILLVIIVLVVLSVSLFLSLYRWNDKQSVSDAPLFPTPPPQPAQVVVMESGRTDDFVWIVLRDKSTMKEYLVTRTVYGSAITSEPLD